MINNPYQTAPMMNNGYVPQYGAYQYNPMANIQRYQPQEQMLPTQMSGTSQQNVMGKIVDSIEAVKAVDIPMDGNIYYFPKADGTEIYGKQWQSDFTTHILTYKPCLDSNPNNLSSNDKKSKFDLSDESTELFMNKFDELFGKIEQLEDRFDKSLGSQRKTSRSQSKESEAE